MSDIIVRPIHPKDTLAQYEMVTHPDVAHNLLAVPSMELAETEAWIQKQTPGRHRMAAELEGKLVGFISLTQHQRPRMHHLGALGMFVHPDYWGEGIGSKLMEAALAVADNWLALKRVELDVFIDNEPAIALYQKFGFEVEGTRRCVAFGNGRFRDDYIMARLRNVDGLKKETEWVEREEKKQLIQSPVTIRPPLETDIEALYEIFRQPSVARTTLQMPTQEIGLMEDRIKTQVKGLHRYVSVVDEVVVGMITLMQNGRPRQAHIGDIGMMVHPDYWGMGIGTKLMDTVLDLADNWLNLKRVELDVNTDNPAGIRLYEKSGFVIEGTRRFHNYGDGRWVDSYFMGRVRD